MPPKFLLLLLSLAVSTSAFAQKLERPMGFVGVPFGTAPADVLRILSARPGLIVPETLPTSVDKLDLTGGNFAAQEVLKWTLEFVDNKFAAATVALKPDGNGPAVYRDLKQNLTSKYGPPTGERKPGLSDTDKKTRQATGARKKEETYGNVSYWKFNATLADKDAKCIICEAAGPDGNEVADETKIQVTIHYIDETLKPLPAKGGVSGALKSSTPVKKEDL